MITKKLKISETFENVEKKKMEAGIIKDFVCIVLY